MGQLEGSVGQDGTSLSAPVPLSDILETILNSLASRQRLQRRQEFFDRDEATSESRPGWRPLWTAVMAIMPRGGNCLPQSDRWNCVSPREGLSEGQQMSNQLLGLRHHREMPSGDLCDLPSR